MILKVLRFLFGYIKVEIYGFAPERFMNLIIKNDVIIWDVSNTEQGYIFYTGRKNLIRMKPFLLKTNMKIKILQKYGMPYVLKKSKKRIAFLTGFCIFCFMIYFLSLFVWEIKVVGEDKLVATSMLKIIEKEYIPLGTAKSNINCMKLEEKLRLKFDEIAWISCELKGTTLTVYLEESMQKKESGKTKKPGDLIAKKDAIITKIITRQGTPMAKVKETVNEGDILISGTVYIYDDNNEIMETSYVTADGDIYGTTTEKYDDYLELDYYKKIYEKKSKTYISFFFLDYCFTPFLPSNNNNCDSITQIHKAKIFNDFYLPFGYKTIKKTSFTLERRRYKEDEAKKILKNKLEKNLKSFSEKGVQIIENNVTIEHDKDKMIARGNIILNEPIAIFQPSSGNIKKIEE